MYLRTNECLLPRYTGYRRRTWAELSSHSSRELLVTLSDRPALRGTVDAECVFEDAGLLVTDATMSRACVSGRVLAKDAKRWCNDEWI